MRDNKIKNKKPDKASKKENYVKGNHVKGNHVKENHVKENHVKKENVKKNHVKEDDIKEEHRKKENEKENDMKKGAVKKDKLTRKTVDFVKLLWSCVTYKMILFIIMVGYVIYVFSGFKSNVQRQINKNTESYLKSMVNECLEKIRIRINDEFIVLDTMALICDDDIDIDTTKNILTEAVKTHSFEGVQIMDKNKQEIVSIGNVGIYEQDNFIDNALDGANSVSSIYLEDNKEFISLAVPVYDSDNGIQGVLTCNYNISAFTEIIDTSSFGQLGTTIISQEDGVLVSRPDSVEKNANLFTLLDSININNEKSITKLKKSITNGQSGIIVYGKGKHKRYICYNVVPDTGWYSVSIVSASAIEPVAKKVSRLAVNFTIHGGFIIAGYILITLAIDMNLIRKKRGTEKS